MFSEKINTIINRYLKYEHTNLSIGVIIENDTYIVSYKNKQEDKDVDNRLYDIGSLSKVFTSLLMLKEINNKNASLDDNISKYLKLKEGHFWTIKDLLSHHSDFHHLTPFRITISGLLKGRYSKRNVYQEITSKNVIKEANKRRRHKNKKHYGYSDYSYALIALVIQKIGNDKFYNLMNSFIKESLGLKNTFCISENNKRIDSFLRNKKIDNWKWDKDNPYLASGGLQSSIKDMTKFLKILICQKESYIKKSFAIDKKDKEHNLTFFLNKKKTNFWHVGGVGTFRSSMIVNPNRKIGVIVLGNEIGRRNGNTHYLAKAIYTLIRRNKFKRKEKNCFH